MAGLAAKVAVHTGAGGTVWYGPGDDVPAEHAALIRNPAAWVDGQVPEPPAPEEPEEPENDPAGNGQGDGDGDDAGKGVDLDSLTVPALTKYAEEREIDLGGASKKDDILAAIRAAQA